MRIGWKWTGVGMESVEKGGPPNIEWADRELRFSRET